MPGPKHQGIVELLRADPRLLLSLLGLDGAGVEAVAVSADLSDVTAPERRADLVIVVTGAFSMVFIVEVQGDIDPDKLMRWPHYGTAARMRDGLPAAVVVVALTERAAAWARREVSLGPMGATATFQHCADQAMQLEEQGYKVNPIILLFARRADDEEEILQTWSSGEAAEMLERLSEFVEDNTDSPVSYDDEDDEDESVPEVLTVPADEYSSEIAAAIGRPAWWVRENPLDALRMACAKARGEEVKL